jgi:dimethylhistidine N-methyltransferase
MNTDFQIIHEGLMAPNAWLSSKFFYDENGSRLFEAITQLPEYYLTRTERTIFEQAQSELVEVIGTGSVMIDLGAGNCEKAERLFKDLRPSHYVAIDVASDFLAATLKRIRADQPAIPVHQVDGDFTHGLTLPADISGDQRLVFFPGSTIGNFDPDEAVGLLSEIARLAGPSGRCLIGIDLVKPTEILEAAYNDAQGITAEFNLNILNVVNEVAQADFDLCQWEHRAFFNAAKGRIEMHLESISDQWVHWCGGQRQFKRVERIHTENSYKFTLKGFESLLQAAGLNQRSMFTDDQQWFALVIAEPA